MHIMTVKNFPYWVKGGLLAMPVCIVALPVLVGLLYLLGKEGEMVIPILAPEVFVLIWSMAMGGAPLTSILLMCLIFLGKAFVLGAVIGAVYGFSARRSRVRQFWIGFALLAVLVFMGINYMVQNPYTLYDTVQTAEECTDPLKKFIPEFQDFECLDRLATRTGDISVCGLINNPKWEARDNEIWRWSCYEDIASAKNDPAVCDLIPTEASMRDRCYSMFSVCENISDPGMKADCERSRAGQF